MISMVTTFIRQYGDRRSLLTSSTNSLGLDSGMC